MGDHSLVHRIREVVGGDLRSVVRYTGEDLGLEREPLYVRDDVTDVTDEYDLAEIRRSLKLGETTTESIREKIGEPAHYGTVRVYESVALVYFPHDEAHRTVVTLDVTGLRDLPAVFETAVDELYPDAFISPTDSNVHPSR